MHSDTPKLITFMKATDVQRKRSSSTTKYLATTRWMRSLLVVIALLLSGLLSPTASALSYQRTVWLDIVPPLLTTEAEQRIAQERKDLLSHRPYLEQRLLAAQPLIRYIGQQVENKRLPAIIILLPLIESSYRLDGVSGKGAAGLWQLMPQTAKRFGLPINPAYDARLSVPHATTAALTYLSWLQDYFNGDWLLALAAYNAGEGRVRQAQQESGELGFWRLPLPTETRRYVPRLLALADIIQHAERYGVHLPNWQHGENLVSRQVTGPAHLSSLAQQGNWPLRELEAWNPAFRQGFLPAGLMYSLLLPPKQAAALDRQPLRPPPVVELGLDLTPIPPLLDLGALDDPLLIQSLAPEQQKRATLSLQRVTDPLGLQRTQAQPLISR
jgi:membrane-bound lytic murein transglycosylase D